jgi:hypothetical protein
MVALSIGATEKEMLCEAFTVAVAGVTLVMEVNSALLVATRKELQEICGGSRDCPSEGGKGK